MRGSVKVAVILKGQVTRTVDITFMNLNFFLVAKGVKLVNRHH